MTSALKVPINAIHKPDAVKYRGGGRGKGGGIDD